MKIVYKAMMCCMIAILALVTYSCDKEKDNNFVICPVDGFTCDINSTVTLPSGQQYFVNSGVNKVDISSINESLVMLRFPSFVAESEQLRTPITIGEIVVDSVNVSQTASGDLTLSKGEFNYQSSTYFIKGHSIKGSIADGKLSVIIDYTPGNMPFGLITKFTSK